MLAAVVVAPDQILCPRYRPAKLDVDGHFTRVVQELLSHTSAMSL